MPKKIHVDSIICILVWKYPEYIEGLLARLAAYSVSQNPYVIYILDQVSDERTKRILDEYNNLFELVRLPSNIGFSAGHNLVYRTASRQYEFEYFVPVNSDIAFEENGWLDKINSPITAHPQSALAGPTGLRICTEPQIYGDCRIVTEDDMLKGKFDTISGSVFSIKNTVISTIGLFDEIFSPGYFEDTDLNLRCKANGFKLMYAPIKHKHDYLDIKNTERDRALLMEEYGNFHERNRRIFIARWEPQDFMKSCY